uniref:Carbohydrate sulfotransferase n=1 Tax=Plectus sambesii TaxID=2011161 RepID=A0A914X8F1_9BILA
MAIICYLYDEKAFEKANKTLAGEADWPRRGCKFNNRAVVDTELLHNPEWLHFVVIREPIERFLSGWMDKCYNLPAKNKGIQKIPTWCYGCKNNLSCFVQRNYESNLQFPQRYKDKYKIINLEDHFWPQNWFCNFTKYFDQYTILKYSHDVDQGHEMFERLQQLLSQQNVEPSFIDKIIRQATERPKHATLGQKPTEHYRNLLLSDKNMMRTLVKTYYHDFVMFSFPFPEL